MDVFAFRWPISDIMARHSGESLAKAGIQACQEFDPASWMPAFAGMTIGAVGYVGYFAKNH
jgi:hypothetical protein